MSLKETNPKNLSFGDLVVSMSWPTTNGNSNSKGKYKSGSKYPEYKRLFNLLKPQNSSSISAKQWRAGAACDIFAATALRAYGITDFPVTLSKQCDYFFRTNNYQKYFTKIDTKGGTSKLKHGDVVVRINKGSKNNGQGHIYIAVDYKGKKYHANAHYRKGPGYYGVIDNYSKKDKNSEPSQNKYWGAFRLKDSVITSLYSPGLQPVEPATQSSETTETVVQPFNTVQSQYAQLLRKINGN